jgi:integrase
MAYVERHRRRRDGRADLVTWRARYVEPDGRERSKTFDRKVDADKFIAETEAAKLRGDYIDPTTAKTTVGEWCATWLDGYGTRRASSVRQARVHLAQIEAAFGRMPLSAVRPSHVKAWTAKLRSDGLADSYVYALHSRLAQLFTDAVLDGIVARSPCSRRTSPGAGKQRAYVATTEHVWALYDAMPERSSAAILLGAFAGLRLAEACGLRVSDVDFMRGSIKPAVQYPAQPLKTETSRTAIPIPQSLARLLAAQVQRFPGETLLTNEHGGQLHPRVLERAFRSARNAVADLPGGFRYQDLRHYLASLLIASGADVKVVQARLRHASAKTTLDVYGHLWPDSDESSRAAVEAVFAARADDRAAR